MYCTRCGTWTPDGEAACARCGEPLAAAIAPPPAAPATPTPAAAAPYTAQAPAAVATPTVRYAGFWRRFCSMFVDGLVLFFPDAILRVSLGLPTAFSIRPMRADEGGTLLAALAITTGAWWIYCATLESSHWQGTLGQQLMGIRVRDTHLRRISFGRATGRFVAQSLSWLLCGGGFLFNLWTSRRQTLHDLVAGCVLTAPEHEPVPGVAAEMGGRS